jgi:hypothetical protein
MKQQSTCRHVAQLELIPSQPVFVHLFSYAVCKMEKHNIANE